MSIHQYRTEQFLPISIEKAWDFFSSPMNLSVITPPEMKFKVLSRGLSKKIYTGMEIDYSVRPLMGIPMKWKTLIDHVEDFRHFSDKQLRGPYRLWEHSHTFVEKENGVLMIDVINYQLPLGFLGDLMHKIVVGKKVRSIFEYRRHVLNKLFIQNARLDH